MSFFNFTVPQDFLGVSRLDKYVSENCPDMNRSKLKNGVTQIKNNGKDAKLSSKIRAGDQISIFWEDLIPENIIPEDLPLEIIYEDDNVTVINKKQGMVTHPATGNWTGTLVNALLFRWNLSSIPLEDSKTQLQISSVHRPGIVHRLDKDTSGIIITARNRNAEDFLQKQFQKRYVKKEYIAIVCGRPKQKNGVITTQIIRDPKDRKRFKAVVDTQAGKYAKTIYHCIASYGNYSLMRFRIKTGRTHQIRVHSKFIGCPILGDCIYNQKKDTFFPDATLMLHSRYLKIRLPETKQFSIFYARVPQRFKNVLAFLHDNFPKE